MSKKNSESKGVQDNYSELMGHNVFDEQGRIKKAKKIVKILEEYSGKDLAKSTVLDFGSSTGIITTVLADHFKKVDGVDIDKPGIEFSKKYGCDRKNLRFFLADLLTVDKGDVDLDEKYDFVICNQIYEHVSSAEKMFEVIDSYLKDGGIVYFGATNRLILMEPHYNLPLLSWFPKPLANIYIRMFTKHETYYEDLQDYFSLSKMVKRHFEMKDVTIDVIKNPAKFEADDVSALKILRYFPDFFLKVFLIFSPNWIWILKKT